MNDTYTELLTIGEAAKRLAHTSEVSLRYRIAQGEVRAVRPYGRILVRKDKLRRCFPFEYKPAPTK